MSFHTRALRSVSVLTAALWIGAAAAAPLPPSLNSGTYYEPVRAVIESDGIHAGLAPELQRTVVNYPSDAAAGTVIVDTAHTYLYFVLGEGRAIRYGIGVGREGFTWSGAEKVTRKTEWPDWTPPQEMITRQPYLPRWVAGGEGNPLGARAIYLGNTIYRIHGTNMPETIGQKVSSGCIRMLNADVADLYSRVTVGTQVIVLTNPGAVAGVVARVSPAGLRAPHTDTLRASYIY